MRFSILMKSWDGWIEMLGIWKGLENVCVIVGLLIWVLWVSGLLGVVGELGNNERLLGWIEW